MRPSGSILTLLLVCTACGQPAKESAEQNRLRNQVYFSVDDPGRWKDFAKDHAPQVKVSGGKIEVEVPFTAEMGHYTEVIFIQDMAQREVALRTFKRGEKAHATLSIPLEKMPGAAVITKCNLHGMWKKSIVQ